MIIFGKRTALSLLFFLIYAYLNISACRKFSLSLSTYMKIFVISNSKLFESNKDLIFDNNEIENNQIQSQFQLDHYYLKYTGS